MRPTLIIKTLGQFQVIRGGRQVRIERTKHKALLAYLGINRGKWCGRSVLADLLWESSSEEKGRHSLNQALYSLRRVLPEFFLVQKESIQCEDGYVTTDIDEVTELIRHGNVQEAVSAMRGAFLEDVDIKHAPEFERWKSDLNRHFYRSNERTLLSRIGEYSPAEHHLLWREARNFTLMPELRQFLETAEAKRVTQLEGSAHAGADQHVRHAFTLPFKGRETHVAILRTTLERCRGGEAAFVVLTGQPGIGKTRLAEEFLTALADARHIRLKCYEAEQRVGFGPIVDLLTNGILPQDLAGLQPIWKTVLGDLLPEKYAAGISPPRLSGLSGQSRLFQAVLQALKEVAKETPLVLFVDDVQWMDRSTRALFSFLTHRLCSERVMIIAALRRKSPVNSIPTPWSEWTRIEVSELAHEDASRMVKDTAAQFRVPMPSLDSILSLTGGHPYLLNEVLGRVAAGDSEDLRFFEREIPPRVEEFVGYLFRSLPKQSQTLLAVLALLGRPTNIHILQNITRSRNLSAPLDILLEREIAAVSKHGIGLRHDLIREAAYRRIPLFTRTALHRRAAMVLADTNDHAGEAAVHFYKGGLRAKAYDYAIKAAQTADGRHAFDESVSFLRLAAKARPSRSHEVLPTLAERLHRLHRFREARAALQRGLKGGHQRRQDLEILDLELAYSIGTINGVDLRSKTSLFKESNSPIDSSLMFRLLRLEARSAHHDGDRESALLATRQLRTLGLEMDGYEGLEAVTYAARGHSLLASSFEAEKWVLEAVAKVSGMPENEIGIRTMGVFGVILYEVGKLEAAERMHNEAMRSADAIGAISEWPLLGVHAHMLLVEQGKFDHARKLASEVRRRVLPEEAARALATLVANEAAMNFELENFEAAEGLIAETLTYVKATNSIWLELEITGLRGLIFLSQGRISEAQKCHEVAKGGMSRLGYRCGDVSSIEILNSRMHHRRGATDVAIAELRLAITDYRERDVICRLRMELELARFLRSTDRTKSRDQANSVFYEATRIGARPLAEAADALLLRL